jgi:hypothetical protein
MPVRVVLVGYMPVRVPRGHVPMPMAMLPGRHGIVGVTVMPVVVAVSVFVFHRLMLMIVGVRLRQVNHDPQHHEDGAG